MGLICHRGVAMTAAEILEQLKSLGSESYKKVLRNHCVPEPFFGVKIEDMKKILKKVGKDYQLAKDLFATGNYDAMYLAGLIADDARMTKKDLREWIKTAKCGMLFTYTIPWVTAGSKHGFDLALEWIDSKEEQVATAGWSTLGSLVGIREDSELDHSLLKKLLLRAQKTVHVQPNQVRYAINAFVICVGCYVAELTELAMETAQAMGRVQVDMGKTACKVPSAVEYILKVRDRGTIGKKRKSAKC